MPWSNFVSSAIASSGSGMALQWNVVLRYLLVVSTGICG